MSEWDDKLRRVKQHPQFPFPEFRNDETQYMALELFWTYLFKSVVSESSREPWRPWIEPDREREGNPIFSAVNPVSGRGTQVIQHPGREDADVKEWGYFPFQPYLSRASVEAGGSERAVLGFYFVADVSEASEAYARQFWRWFCVDGISEAEMERQIKKYEDTVGMRSPQF